MAGKRRYRPPVTQAEKQQRDQARAAQLEQLHAQLADSVRALRTGEDWQKWLNTASHLTGYSFNNTLAIYAQCPHATKIAGYKAWQALGRQVHKGERGIRILAPITKRSERENTSREQGGTPSDSSNPQRTVVGYQVVHVWDISQTTGEALPLPPGMSLITGQAPPGLSQGLADLTARQGFTLDRAELPGRTLGVTDYTARTVTLHTKLDDADAAKVLAHELGHILLQHEQLMIGECRGRLEVEAESVAYLVAASRGLATGDYSFGYVTNWATRVEGKQPEEVVTETGQRVMSAAATIIEHLETQTHNSVITELSDRAEQAANRTSAIARRADAAMIHADRRQLDAASFPQRSDLIALHEAALARYRDNLHRSGAPIAYLKSRGLHPIENNTWKLGYATAGWTDLVNHLRGHGFTEAAIEEAGLGLRGRDGTLIDRFHDRIMIPLRNSAADAVGFIGRTLSDNPNMAKYLNSPETPIYSKSTILYGLIEQQHQLRSGAQPALVEGPLDVLAIAHSDTKLVGVSPCGTALTAHHVSALRDAISGTASVVVAFDGDPAGRNATNRAYDLLQGHLGPCRTVTWPNGSDPASYRNTNGAAALHYHLQHAQRPLVEAVIDDHLDRWQLGLDHIESRVAAARAIAPLLVAPPGNDIGPRAAYLAQQTRLSHESVTGILVDALETQASSGQRVHNRGRPDEADVMRNAAALAHQGFGTTLTLTDAQALESVTMSKASAPEQVTQSL